jgi:hypothetical protein
VAAVGLIASNNVRFSSDILKSACLWSLGVSIVFGVSFMVGVVLFCLGTTKLPWIGLVIALGGNCGWSRTDLRVREA